MRSLPRLDYLLALVPVVTDWVDSGHLPTDPREYVTEVVLGLLIAAGVWRLHREANRMRALALTDALTGLCNRRCFDLDLAREVTRARRLGTPLTLAYVDVDRFKEINDRLGHATGDRVLQYISGRLGGSTREGVDFAYRIGGDEFAVLFTGDGGLSAPDLVDRVITENPDDLPRLSVSVGLVELQGGDDAAALVARADARMYERKARRRVEPATTERSSTRSAGHGPIQTERSR